MGSSEAVVPVRVTTAGLKPEQEVSCDLFPSDGWDSQELLVESTLEFHGTWNGRDQPVLLVCHLLTGGPSFILAPNQPKSLPAWFAQRHSVSLSGNKATFAYQAGACSFLLVAVQGIAPRSRGAPLPVFLGYRCGLAAADLMVDALHSRRLPLVFDLDETLLYARSLSQLRGDLRAFEEKRAAGRVSGEGEAGQVAEREQHYIRQDVELLQQFAENEYVDWQGSRIAARYEDGVDDQGNRVTRPVIKLTSEHGKMEIVLIRMNPAPGQENSSMIFRIRPHWRSFYSYLTGAAEGGRAGGVAGQLRFNVFVCTAATRREYALEVLRALDTGGVMIPRAEVHRRLFWSMKSKSLGTVLGTKEAKFSQHCRMPLAVVVDDRTDVWEEEDRPSILQVEPFLPHKEMAAGDVGAKDQPTLQTLEEEMVRVQAQLANLRRNSFYAIDHSIMPQVATLLSQVQLDLSRPFRHLAALLPPPPTVAAMLKEGLHRSTGLPTLPSLPPAKHAPTATLKPQDPRFTRSMAAIQQAQQGQGQPAPAQQAQQPSLLPADPRKRQQQQQQQEQQAQQAAESVVGGTGAGDSMGGAGRGGGRGRGAQQPPVAPIPSQAAGVGVAPQVQPAPRPPGGAQQAQQQQSAWGTSIAAPALRPPQLPGMLAPAPGVGAGAGLPPQVQGHLAPAQQAQRPSAGPEPLHQGWFEMKEVGEPGTSNQAQQPPFQPPPGQHHQHQQPQQQPPGVVGQGYVRPPGASLQQPRPPLHAHPRPPQPPFGQQAQQGPPRPPTLPRPSSQGGRPDTPPLQGQPLLLPEHPQQAQQQQFGARAGVAAPHQGQGWAGAGKRKADASSLEGEGVPKAARLSGQDGWWQQQQQHGGQPEREDPVVFLSRAAQELRVRLQYIFKPIPPQQAAGSSAQAPPPLQWEASVIWDGRPVSASVGSQKGLAKQGAAREAIQKLQLLPPPPAFLPQPSQAHVRQPQEAQQGGPERRGPLLIRQGVPGRVTPPPFLKQQPPQQQLPRPPTLAPPTQQEAPPAAGMRPPGGATLGQGPPVHRPLLLLQQQQAQQPQAPMQGGKPGGQGVGGGQPPEWAAGVPGRGMGGRGRGGRGLFNPAQHAQQQQHGPRINNHNAINKLRDHFGAADRYVFDSEIPQDEPGTFKVRLVVNDDEYVEVGRCVVTQLDQTRKDGTHRVMQRAKQDAALKVLDRVGYAVDYANTYTGGVRSEADLMQLHQQSLLGRGGRGRGATGEGGGVPSGGRGGVAPGRGGGSGRGAPDGMKRYKLGAHSNRSLDTRAARAAAAGPQAPPPDVYMSQLDQELA